MPGHTARSPRPRPPAYQTPANVTSISLDVNRAIAPNHVVRSIVRPVAVPVFVFGCLLTSPGAGQTAPIDTAPRGQIMIGKPNPFLDTVTSRNRPDLRYREAEKPLAEHAFDPAAEELLRAAERFASRVFKMPDLELLKAVTYKDDHGDHLVAQWAFRQSAARAVVILVDHPWRSLYHFRLPGFRVVVREDVDRLVSALVEMNKPPIRIEPDRCRYKVFGDGGVITSFSWGYDPPIPTATPSIDDFSVLGAAGRGEWFVTASLGKALTATHYPVEPFVPERFPPLESLVKTWSDDRIREELARTGRADVFGHRQDILLAEAVRRGLSTEQIVELLRSAPAGREYARLASLERILARNGQGSAFSEYFEPALRMYEQMDSRRAMDAIRLLFYRARKRCSPAFERHALRVLREDESRLAAGPLSYLDSCAASQEALQLVEELRVSENLESQRQFAAQRIRKRLEKASAVRR